ncbi:AraC-type DNA-binding protein [Evansella caseinilytica]|uniref:AraC-type DNA-binding protein n=1 Tax=Evansella caseinilytica TaxID=1503961 RepID=A0A1H3PMY3_9BACI|nr:AraC family transcriptional regulator [Evansella caseinilytica]SDZ02301.1 AraC-type DNA-binding protein [Evansella caseinilytica]
MEIITFKIPPAPIFIKGGKATFRIGEKHFHRVFHIFDFIYVSKGTLYMKEGNNEYALKEGQYLFLSPGKAHGGYKGCVEETEYYWIHFTLEQSFEHMEKKEFDWWDIMVKDSTITESAEYNLHLPNYGTFRNEHRGEEAFIKIIELNQSSNPADKLRQQLYFYELMIELQQDAIDLPSSAQSVTDQMIQYIKQHYQEEQFTIRQMAKDLLYHPDYLTRCMKKMLGMTPVQYLNYYRIAMAKAKLVHEHLNLTTIARECGFSDVGYFSRIFKKREGITPGQYRRMRKDYDDK